MELNQIYLGDCLEVMRNIPDKSIDLVLTDPPYGMSFQSNHRKEKHSKIIDDDNLYWLEDFILEVKRVKKEDAHVYMFCSMHHVDTFVSLCKKHLNYKNIVIWHKNNTGMGDLYGDYAPKYEFVIFCSNGDKKLNGKRNSNIKFAKKTGNELHPTQKPKELIGYFINKSSEENDTILDPFAGSGTTAIACHDLKRNFICIEKEPEYHAIATKRYNEAKAQLTLF